MAVGTDGSTTAGEAVKEAAEIARRFDARLVLLSAFEDGGGAPAGDDIELQWASNPSARVKSILERTEADLRSGGIQCETRIGGGEPSEVLVRLAADCGADLLVIGNRGDAAACARQRAEQRHAQGRLLGARRQDDVSSAAA